MVYCTKCGHQNEDGVEFCVKCGASLKVSRPEKRYRSSDGCFGPRSEDECFGLPHGGLIAGIIFGLFIIVIGISILLQVDVWRWLGPTLIIILGLLIVLGVLYRRRWL
ncbi:zinc-ribbon domain-containing protein [Candidatus Bathyarchaeota archaeon]|nr:zinc-ribbon domain-containing protein [Candidatus Bathyarchaeota archaeon]